MTQDQLDRFKRWFDEYTSRFLGDDAYVNANLQGKQAHTRRTCREILLLADGLALDDNQKRIADLIALFHDVGRFPQFAQYRTFSDPKSVDHGRLGVEVLRQEGILEALPSDERQWTEAAVECHSRKTVPSHLSGQALLFTKLIRDADKLDIFRLIVDKYKRYQDDPDGFMFEVELPDEPGYCPEVVEAVLTGDLIDYGKLRTLNDMKLCHLGWVYDLNFPASLQRVRQCNFLPDLLSFLPQNEDMQKVGHQVLDYVDTQLAQST